MNKKYILIALCVVLVGGVATTHADDTSGLCGSKVGQISRILKQGMQGTDVAALQSFLKFTTNSNLGITGYFGAVTANALKSFQSANNVLPTGILGYFSRNLIAFYDCNEVSVPLGSIPAMPNQIYQSVGPTGSPTSLPNTSSYGSSNNSFNPTTYTPGGGQTSTTGNVNTSPNSSNTSTETFNPSSYTPGN